MAELLKEKRSWYFLGLWLLTTVGAWAMLFSTIVIEFIGNLAGSPPFFLVSLILVPLILGLLQFFVLRMLLEDRRVWLWLYLIPHIVFFWLGLLFAYDLGMFFIFAGLCMGSSISAGGVLLFYNAKWGILLCSMAMLIWIVSAVVFNIRGLALFMRNLPEPALLLLNVPYLLIIGLILLIGFRSKPEQLEQATS